MPRSLRLSSTRAAFAAALVGVAAASAVGVVAAGNRMTQARAADDAPAFAARLVRQIGGNRYALAWQTLHPRQQLAAPQREYVSCEERTPIPGKVVSVRVLRSSDATFDVAGVEQAVTGKAVKVRIVIAGFAMPEGVSVLDTVHLVRVDGRWRWILPPESFERYADDSC